MDINYEEYVKNVSNDELIDTIEKMGDYERVTIALTELAIRDNSISSPLCCKIVGESLGDEYLQAVAFNLLYEFDGNKAVELVNNKLDQVSVALLGAIMDNLSMDSLQQFGKELSTEFLRSVQNRYLNLPDNDKKRINENYEWFIQSYSDRLR